MQKHQRIKVTNCMTIQGSRPWQGALGTVEVIEPGAEGRRWIWVKLDGDPYKKSFPFREGELSAADKDDTAPKDASWPPSLGS